jgi:hypothetical protein
MNADDLKALRNPLILLAAIVALGSAAIFYLDQSLTAARREFTQQTNQLREARTRLQRSGDEKQIIVRYLPSYQNLEKIGFVGEEQRLNWVEGLRLSNQQSQLFGVTYQISVQQPYPYANELNPGQLSIHHSLMKISFNLLHEGDLLRLLTTLGKQGAGFFSVNHCQMDRSGAVNITAGATVRYQPNLRAECDLSWITVTAPASPTAEKKP